MFFGRIKTRCLAIGITCGIALLTWIILNSFICISVQQCKIIKRNLINQNQLENKKIKKRKQPDAVILLSMIRSGSSILGSIFNEQRNVTYLYEPLFPFGVHSDEDCNKTFNQNDVLSVLRSIVTCDFENILPYYRRSSRTNRYAKCLTHHLCFATDSNKFLKFLSRDAGICERTIYGGQKCPEPIDQVPLQNHCRKSSLIALKVNYLCKLDWILPLLKEDGINIKVVHLVRDPRSNINSRVPPNGPMEAIKSSTLDVCGRLAHNLPVGDMMMESKLFRDRYLRVRFEDFASNPICQAEEIYRFVGMEITREVENWLLKSTCNWNRKDISRINDQGLRRNPHDVLIRWRKELSYDKLRYVQAKCSNVLKKLNYKIYDSEIDYRDVSKLHFSPKDNYE